jgi:hypothetical protein
METDLILGLTAVEEEEDIAQDGQTHELARHFNCHAKQSATEGPDLHGRRIQKTTKRIRDSKTQHRSLTKSDRSPGVTCDFKELLWIRGMCVLKFVSVVHDWRIDFSVVL